MSGISSSRRSIIDICAGVLSNFVTDHFFGDIDRQHRDLAAYFAYGGLFLKPYLAFRLFELFLGFGLRLSLRLADDTLLGGGGFVQDFHLIFARLLQQGFAFGFDIVQLGFLPLWPLPETFRRKPYAPRPSS